jgi:hypothetical protein
MWGLAEHDRGAAAIDRLEADRAYLLKVEARLQANPMRHRLWP